LPIFSKKTPLLPQSLQLDRDFAGRQTLGSRDEQQDSYAFSIVDGDENGAERLLVVIADGVGGHIGGRQASLAAVKHFVDAFFEALEEPQNSESREATPLPAESPLQHALTAANRALDEMIKADPETLGEAGTTLVAALVDRQSLRWISVGDSPLLLWRKGKLIRLNADHSMRAVFAEKVAARQMRPTDVQTHPERNALLAALNGLEISQIDAPQDPYSLKPGDILLAASDGLLTLTNEELCKELKKLSSAPSVEVVHKLLEKVEKSANPKQDNTTVAVIKV